MKLKNEGKNEEFDKLIEERMAVAQVVVAGQKTKLKIPYDKIETKELVSSAAGMVEDAMDLGCPECKTSPLGDVRAAILQNADVLLKIPELQCAALGLSLDESNIFIMSTTMTGGESGDELFLDADVKVGWPLLSALIEKLKYVGLGKVTIRSSESFEPTMRVLESDMSFDSSNYIQTESYSNSVQAEVDQGDQSNIPAPIFDEAVGK